MTKELFALALAGTLLVPLITPAVGTDETVGLGAPKDMPSAAIAPSRDMALLPPVPHLQAMPWLASSSALLGPKLDTLGPFLVKPAIPAGQFSGAIDAEPVPIPRSDPRWATE